MDNILIHTPHPVTLDGQTRCEYDLIPGESLFAFLHRHVPDIGDRPYVVMVGGVEVPLEHWSRTRLKHGQTVEVLGSVGRNALTMVAIVALSIWTGGAASALAGGGSVFGLYGAAGYAAVLAVNVGAGLLVNKMMAPKLGGSSAKQASAVSTLTGSQNRFRPDEPTGLLFGTARIAPDQLSKPYNFYKGDEMYLALHLSWGIGVHTVDQLYLGDTPIVDYANDVSVWHTGFSGMPQQQLPLFGNVDTITGGALQDDDGNLTPVERTTSLNTTRIQWDINIQLFDVTSKGKQKNNQERINCYIRPAGSTSPWVLAGTHYFVSKTNREHRFTIVANVEEGQYDTRVERAGVDTGIENAQCRAALSTLTSVQKDESTYTGIARSGIQLRASSQLNSTPNEIRAVAHSKPIPLWTGTEWVLTSTGNVGANMLKYLRGYYDSNNNLIAGIGYSDDLIDIDAFKAYMVHCTAMGYEYNHWLQQDRDHITQLNAIAYAGLGQYSDAGGLASVMWIAEDQPEDAIVNMARIAKGDFQLDYSLVGTADGIIVKFVDSTTWNEDEVRIPMPGKTTMLNPATIEAEGVTDIELAARIGRYFLAQSLYQYKEISFGTTLEYLSYRRWSKIKLQFDMTQWGYGGVLVGAEKQVGGNLVLELDEPVPYPSTGGGYIGIRVPGQRTYQVFPVEPFTDTSKTLTLVGEWPVGLAVPGDTPQNPAHDSLWIYDFKATPGLTARVTSISPKNGYTGATVSVVPESDEFWNYVINGIYVPSPNSSLLRTRPRVTSLVVTEERVVIDNVVQHQLTASFAIDGPCGHVVTTSDVDSEGVMQIVGESISGRTATWVVDENRPYTITVRPYSPQGLSGIPATLIYSVGGVGAPPPIFDYFNVDEVDGGLRRYTWGYNGDAPANIAGAEIRYVAGAVLNPNWDLIDPLGEGFYTANFESTLPASGEWTFVIRARDTGGNLSIDSIVLIKTLGMTLQDTIDGLGDEDFLPLENPSFESAEGWGYFAYDAFPADQKYWDGIGDECTAPSSVAAPTAYLTRNWRRINGTPGAFGPGARSGEYYARASEYPSQQSVMWSRCDNRENLTNYKTSPHKYLRFVQAGTRISTHVPVGSGREVQGRDNMVVGVVLVRFDKATGAWDGQYYQLSTTTPIETGDVGGYDYVASAGGLMRVDPGTLIGYKNGPGNVSPNATFDPALHVLAIHSMFISNTVFIGSSIARCVDDVSLRIYPPNTVPITEMFQDRQGKSAGSRTLTGTSQYLPNVPALGGSFNKFALTASVGEVWHSPSSSHKTLIPGRNMSYASGTFRWEDHGGINTVPDPATMEIGLGDGWNFVEIVGERDSEDLPTNTVTIDRTGAIKTSSGPYPAKELTIKDGCIHVKQGGQQIIIGSGFGTTGKLMFYVGPGSDPATANPANAFIYYDSDGNHT